MLIKWITPAERILLAFDFGDLDEVASNNVLSNTALENVLPITGFDQFY